MKKNLHHQVLCSAASATLTLFTNKSTFGRAALIGLLFFSCTLSFGQSDGDFRSKFNTTGQSITGTGAWEIYSAATGTWSNTALNPTAGTTTTTTIRDGVTQTANGALTFGGKVIIGEGNAATATATIDGTGAVTAITVTNPGKLIVLPAITIVGTSGTTATATVTSAKITGYEITNAGSGYSAAAIKVGNVWAQNTAYTANTQVNNNGNLYTCTTAGTSDPALTGPAGTGSSITDGTVVWSYAGIAATATATIGAGAITALTITNAGSGYISMPLLTVTGDGTGATATARLGVITVSITNAGSGYTTAPTVYLGTVFQAGNNTTSRTVVMSGDLEFKSGSALFTGGVAETINIGGNLIVASPVFAYTPQLATSAATSVNFIKNGTATISGTGSFAFRNIGLGVTATPATTTLAVSTPVSIAGTVTLNASSVIDASNASISYNTFTTTPVAQTIANNTYLSGLVRNLTINNTSGVTLNQSISVTNQLTMSAGILMIPTTVVMQVAATNAIAGTFGATSFINTSSDATSGAMGMVQMNNVSTARTIPLGNGVNYLPVTLTPSATSTFTASVFTGATDNGMPNGTATADKSKLVDAIYTINRTAGTGNCSVTAGFPAALKGSGFTGINNNQLGVAHYNGASWDVVTGSGDNTQNFATGTFSTFSPFRVEVNLTPSLPVALGELTAAKINNRQVLLTWKVYNETDVNKYIIETSADGSNFNTAGSVDAKGYSSYSFTDTKPSSGSNFYRLKAVDKDNSFTYSKIALVDFSNPAIFSIAPNPVTNGFFTLKTGNMKAGKVALRLYNNAGQLVMDQLINYNGSNDTQLINLPSAIGKGNYHLIVTDGENIKNASLIIK